MRNNILIISLGLVGALSLSSCGESFLYQEPQGSISESALQNQTGIDLLVTSTYANLTENGWGATPFNWVFGSVMGGDANKGSDAGDQSVINELEMFAPLTTNDYVSQKWNWVYKGVQRADMALRVLSGAQGLPEAFVNSRQGELFFLRSLFYFEGVKLMGPKGIAWVPWDNKDNDPMVYNGSDIYPNIEEEITKAIGLLPATQPEAGRANKWAAMALKAKILMQEGKMKDAKPILADLLSNGVTASGAKYGLEDDFNANFDAFTDNGKESIFAAQNSLDANNNGLPGYSLNYPHNVSKDAPGGCCGFYQPSYDLANSYQTKDGLPYLDNSYRDKSSVSYFDGTAVGDADGGYKNRFDIPVDPRLDIAVGRQGVPYKDWGICFTKGYGIRERINGGIFLPKKHVWTKAEEDAGLASRSKYDGWAPAVALNMQYLSVRDMILLYAECLANDGELSAAMEQVNKIRTRAALAVNQPKWGSATAKQVYEIKNYPSNHPAFTDKATCIKAIRFERRLELAMEGQRWYDLSRWSIADPSVMQKETSEYVTYEKKYINKFNFAALSFSHIYLFVPQGQIETKGADSSGKPYLVQNEGW